MVYIEVPDQNDSFSRVVLGGEEVLIRFTYNASYDYWSFGIYDLEENPVLAMCKIVPQSPLTHFYQSLGLPEGIFGALSDLSSIGRDSFVDKDAKFVFIPYSDLTSDE